MRRRAERPAYGWVAIVIVLVQHRAMRNARIMRVVGVLPEDAPDPRLEMKERLRGLSFPVMGLTPQPAAEDIDAIAIADARGMGGQSQCAVSLSYLLWRNPVDRSDPVNLAELDEEERAALEVEPPWPRPAWLREYVDMMRYPQLWEAVRTSWNRDLSEHTTVPRQLVDHANHILRNKFRTQLGLEAGPIHEDGDWEIKAPAVDSSATLEIDGAPVEACEIDTDPFLYAIGAQVGAHVVATIVIAREHLPFVRVSLTTRNSEGDPEIVASAL